MKFRKTYKTQTEGNGKAAQVPDQLCAMSFASDSVGWSIGTRQVLLTTDSGNSWRNFYSDASLLPYAQCEKVACLNEGTCWMTSFFFNECCFTHDRGASWNRLGLSPGMLVGDMYFLKPGFGWIIMNDGSVSANRGILMLTTNGGEKWETAELQLRGRPHKIRFRDHRNGWLVEYSLSRKQGTFRSNIYKTRDSGITWEYLTTINDQIMDFDFFSTESLAAVGIKGIYSLNAENGYSLRNKFSTTVGLNSLHILDEAFGIAVGDLGSVFRTVNGSDTWKALQSMIPDNLVSIHVIDRHSAVLLSESSIYNLRLD